MASVFVMVSLCFFMGLCFALFIASAAMAEGEAARPTANVEAAKARVMRRVTVMMGLLSRPALSLADDKRPFASMKRRVTA